MAESHVKPQKQTDISLLIGTGDGLYGISGDNNSSPDLLLDCGRVARIKRYGEEVFAATRSGLFCSAGRSNKWKNLNVPRKEVWSVLQSPDGKRIYAGTHPSHLYVTADKGESWMELKGLQDLPSRDSWHLPRHRNASHVRSLIAHHEKPDRIIAGIEVGGVHISEDGGKTWSERRNGVHDDIHHLLPLGPDEYIASTGGGLFRTRDAGQTWLRIDEKLNHTYFRESFASGGILYTSAARSSPPFWSDKKGTDGALFESSDGGDTFDSVPYEGQPREFILAWASAGGKSNAIIAGTNGGIILKRSKNKWDKIGQVSSSIHALCVI